MQGKMVIHHVNNTIMEVFEVTGFIDILTIGDGWPIFVASLAAR
ncbi:MAG: hypothetical protein ACI3V5_01460 [Faecousia sp.]